MAEHRLLSGSLNPADPPLTGELPPPSFFEALLPKEALSPYRHVSSPLRSRRNMAVRRSFGKIAKSHPSSDGFETWHEHLAFGQRPLVLALILILIVTGAFCPALATDLDPALIRNLFLIESFREDPSPLNALRLQQSGLPVAADPMLRIFIYFDHTPTTQDLDYLAAKSIRAFPFSYLPPVGFHSFGYLLAEGNASSIRALASSSRFPRITAAQRKLSPKNDLAAEETGAASARTWDPPLSGRGVRLAILDSGFRFEHPDLPDADVTMDYSAYPDTNRDVTDRVSGHGTHVAGTAFGIGRLAGGRWKGMAPDAAPIYFKIGDDTSGDATSEAVIGAIRGAATWAEADILSMSYGGSDGFNDGSSAEEQAVDWAVGEGVSVFMSAGNSAGDKKHYSEVVRANSATGPIQLLVKFAPDSTTWGFALVWFDGSDTSVHREITARLFNGQGAEIGLDALPGTSSPRGTDYREFLSREFLPVDSTNFSIRLTNHSDIDQKVHIWTLSSHWFIRFNDADRSTTVLLPSTADSCISVGAYTSRTRWMDYTGTDHSDRTTRGDIASFSSIGPRIDGRLKPDICAPGRRVISCRDTFNILIGGWLDYAIVSTDGDSGLPADYVAFMGTSMSSPAAAGSAAIILEGEPDLTPPQLRDLIFRRARRDDQTGRTPNTTWGWGKIDVVRALEVAGDNPSMADSPISFRLLNTFPSPSNGGVTIHYDLLLPTALTVTVNDAVGRQIWTSLIASSDIGEKFMVIPDEAINASGVYIIQMSAGGVKASARATIVR